MRPYLEVLEELLKVERELIELEYQKAAEELPHRQALKAISHRYEALKGLAEKSKTLRKEAISCEDIVPVPGIAISKTTQLRVVDIKRVPEKYLMLDEKALKKDIQLEGRLPGGIGVIMEDLHFIKISKRLITGEDNE